MSKLQILSSYIDVSPNEYVTKFSINRNFIKLIENDIDIAKQISSSGSSDIVQSFATGKTYSKGTYVFYKTSAESQSLYLLECQKTTSKPPATIQNTANETIVINSEDWKIVGIPSSIDRNPVDVALEHVQTATSSFLSSHQDNDELSAHPTEELGLSNSTIAFTTLENIAEDRDTLFYPNTLKSLTPDNTIVGGYMRKWDNGLLEYDLIFRVGYFGDNTDAGYQILSANILTATQANQNGLYFKNRDDLRIFAQGDDYYVIVDKTKQVNLNTNVNSYYGQITFPEEFKDLNYMCFASNVKTLESEAKSVANIVLKKSTYDERLIIDGLALEGVKDGASTVAKLVVPKQLKTLKAYSLAGLYEENQYPVQIEIDKDADLVNIEENAFANSEMRKLTIPKNVRCIGKYAFSGCTYLTAVDFYISKDIAKQPIIDFDAFQGCIALSTINLHYVSDSSTLFGAAIDDERNIVYRNDFDLSVKLRIKDYKQYFGIEDSVIVNIFDNTDSPTLKSAYAAPMLNSAPQLAVSQTSAESMLSRIISTVTISSDNDTKTINPQIDDIESLLNSITQVTKKPLMSAKPTFANTVMFAADSTEEITADVPASEYFDNMFKFDSDKTTIEGYTDEFSCNGYEFDLNDNFFSSITAISEDAFKGCTKFTALSCRPDLIINSGAFEDTQLANVDIDLNGKTLVCDSSFKNAKIDVLKLRNITGRDVKKDGVYSGFSPAALKDIAITGNVCSVYLQDVTLDEFTVRISDESLSDDSDLSNYQDDVIGLPNKSYVILSDSILYAYQESADSQIDIKDISYLKINGRSLISTAETSLSDTTIFIPPFIDAISSNAFMSLTLGNCKIDVPNSITSFGTSCFVCAAKMDTADCTYSKVEFQDGLALQQCGTMIFDSYSLLSDITIKA